jgi:hypothetical protein
VVVWREGDGPVAVPLSRLGEASRWTLAGQAQSLAGTVERNADRLVIGDSLPFGYFQLVLHSGDALIGSCTLIAAPAQAYLPPLLKSGGRVWGLATQLFGLRSARNWGIGDFTDLVDLIRHVSAHGAAAIGLTPLRAAARSSTCSMSTSRRCRSSRAARKRRPCAPSPPSTASWSACDQTPT